MPFLTSVLQMLRNAYYSFFLYLLFMFLVGHNSSYKERNPISNLRRLPGESGRDFSLRINSAVKALHNPVEDMNYPVCILLCHFLPFLI